MKLKTILFLSILIMSFQCEDDYNCPDSGGHTELIISNESNTRIHFAHFWKYADTVLKEHNPVSNSQSEIIPGETKSIFANFDDCWESVYAHRHKGWIFFFDADTLDMLGWDIVRDTKRGVLEKKEIDLNYLSDNNFTIKYE